MDWRKGINDSGSRISSGSKINFTTEVAEDTEKMVPPDSIRWYIKANRSLGANGSLVKSCQSIFKKDLSNL
jgi:hypothetical protein